MNGKKLEKIMRLLEKWYGKPRVWKHDDPVETLVTTILSQNTNDRNMLRARNNLLAKYNNWEKLLKVPNREIERLIKVGGLPAIKTKRIKTALKKIKEKRGKIELDFLRKTPLPEARAFLVSLHGVGPKTAAIVLNFCFKKPAFPVDTHVFRVSKRLGLIPMNTSYSKAHELLEEMTPPKKIFSFHVNLIQHGRKTCHARKPECAKCFLLKVCHRNGLPLLTGITGK